MKVWLFAPERWHAPQSWRVILPTALIAIFAIYANSRVWVGADPVWNIHVAMSMIDSHKTDLDDYPRALARHRRWGSIVFHGHVYNMYPLGPSMFSIPFVIAADAVVKASTGTGLKDYLKEDVPWPLGTLIGSTAVVLTALFIFLNAKTQLAPTQAFFTMGVFAFCTSAWSSASRGLVQHGPSMLMLSIAMFLLLRPPRPWMVSLASLPLAFSYVVRPTNAVPIIALTVLVGIKHRRYLPPYLLLSLAVAIPFFAYNFSVYGFPPLSPYYRMPLGERPELWKALAGTLVSPGRGLLFFSPVLSLALYGAVRVFQQKPVDAMGVAAVATVLGHWVVISASPSWWGGWSFGPRLFSDALPFLMYLFAIGFRATTELARGRTAAYLLLGLLTSVSFLIHLRGATSHDANITWNMIPNDIDQHPERIWNWRDIEFLRGL